VQSYRPPQIAHSLGSDRLRAKTECLDLAWSKEESNRFGTDEFLEYCRMLGAEPYICVNMGTGTMDEAQAWVEYCNGTGDTYWANLRRDNGHEEPYNVKYWGLGNESTESGRSGLSRPMTT
jgi:alpha-L-arabinofuranosidase